MFQYLFGPRFSAGSGTTTVYSHVLAGGIYQSEELKGYTSSDGVYIPDESLYKGNGFAMALGGGLEVNINNKFSVRVAQFDWIPFRQEGAWITNAMRFGCGVVIRAGK